MSVEIALLGEITARVNGEHGKPQSWWQAMCLTAPSVVRRLRQSGLALQRHHRRAVRL